MQDVPRTEAPSSLSPPSYAQCLVMLDGAVGEWLDHADDEYSRVRALGMTRAILDGCKVCGYREDSGILVTVASLLERRPDAGASAVADLRERFRGLFRFLKAQARARSA